MTEFLFVQACVFLISNIKFLVTHYSLLSRIPDDCLSVKFSVVNSFDLFYDKLLNITEMSSNLVFSTKMKHENDLKIEELDRILKLFPRNIILILSILETCCAFLAIISRHYFLGDGIWTGPIFLIASLIGFLSWFNPSKLR